MLLTDAALALDPALVMERAGQPPDPWQRRLLRSTAPRILINVTRQGGKSTTVGALAAHAAHYTPGALVLCLSPSQRQSGELHRKVKDSLAVLGDAGAELEQDSVLSTELGNGSRVVALPGKEGTVRGYSGAHLLIVDEASRVSDDLYRAVRPMLAVSGGRLIAPSTPFGKRGWWYEEWEHGGDTWERYEVRADQCPRISREFLAEERRALGVFYAQEYENAFLDPVNALFSGADIDAMLSDEVAPLFPLKPLQEAV